MLKDMLTPMAMLTILASLDAAIIVGLVALGLSAIMGSREVVLEWRMPRLAVAAGESLARLAHAGRLASHLMHTYHVLQSTPWWALIELVSGAAGQLIRSTLAPSGTTTRVVHAQRAVH